MTNKRQQAQVKGCAARRLQAQRNSQTAEQKVAGCRARGALAFCHPEARARTCTSPALELDGVMRAGVPKGRAWIRR